MLLSTVFSFTPKKPLILNGTYGRQNQGWFLSYVENHDSNLSAYLHFSTIRFLKKLGEIEPGLEQIATDQVTEFLRGWIIDNTQLSLDNNETPVGLLNKIRNTNKKAVNQIDGQALSLLVSIVKQFDFELASHIHNYAQQRPYTVSDLLLRGKRENKSGQIEIIPGDECQIRITSIFKPLSELVISKFTDNLPETLRISFFEFQGMKYLENHTWTASTTFAEIAQDISLYRPSNRVRLEFVSPTAFQSNGLDICLPLPGKIFRHLWMKWNAFCPEPMQIQNLWPEFADACILVRELTTVNTHHWMFAEGARGGATGFTGTVEFYLPAKERLHEDWHLDYDGAATVMQFLSKFAFYAGVGHHTTIGMGQTRVISNSKPVLLTKNETRIKRTQG